MLKLFNTAKSSIKTTLDTAISNGMKFSVQLVPLDDKEGNYPSSQSVHEFLLDYITNVIKYKEPNPRALEGMKKAWAKQHGPDVPFVPKLQHSQIVVALIAPSDTMVHVACSVPKDIDFSVPELFQGEVYSCIDRTLHTVSLEPPEGNTVFKYQDELQRSMIAALKEQAIYVEEEDEALEYTINDLK